jgi:hypothetical protein
VRHLRVQILHAWFPALSGAEVQALEPLLHVYGPPRLSGAELAAGLGACERALEQSGESVHGEDRVLVQTILRQQHQCWKQALAAGPRPPADKPV